MDVGATQPAVSPRKVGVICLILTESSLFSIFVVAYVYYIGKSLNGPYPREILELPILATVALLGSSLTIIAAEWFQARANQTLFHAFWALTIFLGVYFLWFTGTEWHHLIYEKGLTVSTNLFGTTFYSLVGLHASHVFVGLILLTLVLVASLTGNIKHEHHEHAAMISWYWHFVDAVWVVVFSLVYVISPNT
jgi:cytochrome c oxidase subunit III